MAWLLQNWVWVRFMAAFIGMHMFGHGAYAGLGYMPIYNVLHRKWIP